MVAAPPDVPKPAPPKPARASKPADGQGFVPNVEENLKKPTISRRKRPTKKATFVDPDEDDDETLKNPSSKVTSMAASFKPKTGAKPPSLNTAPVQGHTIEQRKPSAQARKESELAVPDFLKGAFDEPTQSNQNQSNNNGGGGFDPFAPGVGQSYNDNQHQDNYNYGNNDYYGGQQQTQPANDTRNQSEMDLEAYLAAKKAEEQQPAPAQRAPST